MTGSPANPFVEIELPAEVRLPAGERFPEAGHLWSRQEIDALTLATAARRPLLVRGEAGSGKSQIARAAAHVLRGTEPFVQVIHPRFEALDLLYRFDAIARLGDAQIPNALDLSGERYVKAGALWQAIEVCWAEATTPVLLIDEIDKADADLPNALLEVLGNRSFQVPHLGDRIISTPPGRAPLVIVTTNEERELPAAFVRRCAVLNLNPPEDDDSFVDWLVVRGRVHRHLEVADGVRETAARQALADRKAALQAGYPKVGLAEYIDLLGAVHELTADRRGKDREQKQAEWLAKLSAYALVKNAGQSQSRLPVEPAAHDRGTPPS